MRVIRARNVCEALPLGLGYLLDQGVREDSRSGPVIVAPCPVTTIYLRPTERVLFSAARDANPFFHLFEALWMLAGRDDSASLDRYVRDFGSRFAEPDGSVHDAYGRRWRSKLGYDQLNEIVRRLRADPLDRQCVLQMWDADDENGANDLLGTWRTRPCNTHAYFCVRMHDTEASDVLDMTVCCRSNDMIMGGYGANAVHFSVLQEYLAARIGVEVGTYYQISNNCHVYQKDVDALRARASAGATAADDGDFCSVLFDERYCNPAVQQRLKPQPLVDDPETFDDETRGLLRLHDQEDWANDPPDYHNEFLSGTAYWMLRAHWLWKSALKNSAWLAIQEIQAVDWRAACREWMIRRRK